MKLKKLTTTAFCLTLGTLSASAQVPPPESWKPMSSGYWDQIQWQRFLEGPQVGTPGFGDDVWIDALSVYASAIDRGGNTVIAGSGYSGSRLYLDDAFTVRGGSLTIQAGAEINAQRIELISTDTSATLNIDVNPFASGGVQVQEIEGSAAPTGPNSIINFNHTYQGGSVYEFGVSLTGAIDVVASAGATMLTGSNSHTGTTLVSGGSLTVSGSNLGSGDVTVQSGHLQINLPYSSVISNNINVHGASSLLEGRSFDLRFDGKNDLEQQVNVSGEGMIQAYYAVIGVTDSQSSKVTVTGTGSKMELTGSLTVGDLGNGKLIINNGGFSDNAKTIIGASEGSNGIVQVDGTNSRFETDRQVDMMTVGSRGTGSLEVSNGGFVKAYNTVIGEWESGSGTVKVSGTGSRFENSSQIEKLTVGSRGQGSLEITKGGYANASNAVVGDFYGSTGAVKVDGTNSRLDTDHLTVGGKGIGSMQVINGGLANVQYNASIVGDGPEEGNGGKVTVSGLNSELKIGNNLSIGYGGSYSVYGGESSLVVSDRAKVTIGNGSGDIILARNQGTASITIGGSVGQAAAASGTISARQIVGNVGGVNEVNFNFLGANRFATSVVGNVNVNIYAGSLTLSQASYTGITSIFGGELRVQTISNIGFGDIYIEENGTLWSKISLNNKIHLNGGSYVQEVQQGAALNISTQSMGGSGSTATGAAILGGQQNSAAPVTNSFSLVSTAANDSQRISDVFSISGTGDSVFVLSLEVNNITSEAFLGWYDSDTNRWVNAIEGNTGNNEAYSLTQFSGSYDDFVALFGDNPADYIGAWGNDGNSVWAVINHNSDFAVVPEPSTYALFVLSAFGIALMRKKRKL